MTFTGNVSDSPLMSPVPSEVSNTNFELLSSQKERSTTPTPLATDITYDEQSPDHMQKPKVINLNTQIVDSDTKKV